MFYSQSKIGESFWKNGFAEDCPIIDFHGHMNPCSGSYLPECSVERVRAKMTRCGTKLMLFSSHDALLTPADQHQTDIDIVRDHSDALRAYFVVNANSSDMKADFECFTSNQDVFVGLKNLAEHYQYPITHKAYDEFHQYIDSEGLLYLCHTWGSDKYDGVVEAEKFLKAYPNVVFIAGHSFHGEWEEAARLSDTYENLYLELTAVIDEVGPLEFLLNKCGSEKILFGTDLPWFDTFHGIGYILSTKMSDSDRENILYKNGARLLSRYEWFRRLWVS